jgi:hypothetical protein
MASAAPKILTTKAPAASRRWQASALAGTAAGRQASASSPPRCLAPTAATARSILTPIYQFVSNDFNRRGGDEYTVFAENAINPYDFGSPRSTRLLADYITEFSPVNPVVEGRITRVDAAAPEDDTGGNADTEPRSPPKKPHPRSAYRTADHRRRRRKLAAAGRADCARRAGCYADRASAWEREPLSVRCSRSSLLRRLRSGTCCFFLRNLRSATFPGLE